MIHDNMFRFVVVRPPQLVTPPRAQAFANSEVADSMAGRITAKRASDPTLTWQDAAAAVGIDILVSSAYWIRNDGARALGFGCQDISPLVLQAQREPGDVKVFLRRAQEWLDQARPPRGQIQTWVRSREYESLRNAAWISWYAYAMTPTGEPQDAELLVQSILLLELIGTAVSDDQAFRRAATASLSEGPALRPDVVLGPMPEPAPPSTLVKMPPPGATGDSAAEDDRLDQWLIENILALRAVRHRLRVLFEAKLGVQRPVVRFITSVGSSATKNTVGYRPVEESAPWRVSEADLKADPELSSQLREIGFMPSQEGIPEALRRIDQDLADLTQRLYSRWRPQEITAIDGQPVRVVTQVEREVLER